MFKAGKIGQILSPSVVSSSTLHSSLGGQVRSRSTNGAIAAPAVESIGAISDSGIKRDHSPDNLLYKKFPLRVESSEIKRVKLDNEHI